MFLDKSKESIISDVISLIHETDSNRVLFEFPSWGLQKMAPKMYKNFDSLHGRQARRDGSDFLNDHSAEARGKYTSVIGLHSPVRVTRVTGGNRAMDVAPHGGLPVSRKRRNAKYDRLNSRNGVTFFAHSILLIDAVQNHQKS